MRVPSPGRVWKYPSMPAHVDSAPAPAAVRNLADLLTVAAAEHADKLAVVEAGGRSLTWAQLEDEAGRFATGLGHAGVVAGYRVMLVLGNRLEFVTTYVGTLRAQAVAVPVNPRASAEQLAWLMADCGARMVVCDADTVRVVRRTVADLEHPPRVVVVGATLQPGERSYDHLRADSARPAPELLDPERLACVLYTTGVAGEPRGAMLSHRALLANIEQVASVEPAMIHGDDVVLGVLPLFHVYGLNAVLGSVLRRRAKLVLVDGFDPQGVLDIVDDEACSVVPVAPPAFAPWRDEEALAERLGPARLVLSGSASLAAEVVADFEQRTGVPVHQGYGLTEAAPVVTSTLCSRAPAAGSLGAPLPGVEIRLVDDARRPVEPGDPGQVEIRGDNLFSGYWPDGADGPGEDGWWATGDVGYLDAAGDLFLVDRLEDVVTVSGFAVYPAEVEEAVREVDGVAAAAVIGVPDEVTGQAVVAYVVPRERSGEQAGQQVGDALAGAVRAHCADRLARFKQPTRVEVVESLPLSMTGKVNRGRLRILARRQATGLLE